MGGCLSSSATVNQTPSTTTNFSSAGVSQTTNNTTTLNSSIVSSGTNGQASPNGHNLIQSNVKVFSYAVLRAATKNFRSHTVLGEDSPGSIVYKGYLDDTGAPRWGSGSEIAVKKLNAESDEGFEGWQSEVELLGNLSHPNLVKLLGYCLEDKELLLVYEFMRKGSLENHIFRSSMFKLNFRWEIRLKVLIGAARGLLTLHSLERQVIYGDFKASKILLDGSYNAKISVFGLAKLRPTASQSHVTRRVIPTLGYAAPEYVATGQLHVQNDVYSFGVVMVEMLTGLRSFDANRPNGEHVLVDWIKPHLSDRRKLKIIMDYRLEGNYPFQSALRLAQLALTCIGNERRTRPPMKDVLETLERIESANENQV